MQTHIKLHGSLLTKWNYFTNNNFEVWLYDQWNSGFYEAIQSILTSKGPDEEQLISEVISTVQSWNHPFALVIRSSNHCLVFTDHIQSYTLFYVVSGHTVSISDEPYSILNEESALSKPHLQGFMFTRYALGDRTFMNNLYQLPAGQYLHVTDSNYEIKDHYIFQNEYRKSIDPENKKNEIYETTIQVFKNLLELTGDRQLILFFSGGYDSRFILWALDKLQAPNVLLCSYGRKWQRDVNWAGKFAEFVPYPWVYVKKNYRSMRKYYQSMDKREYYSKNHKLCRKPNTMDMVAIHDLKRRGMVDDNAIFLNGNSGGFISGAHLENELAQPVSYQTVADLVCKRHCVMWNWQDAPKEVKDTVYQQILTDLKQAPIQEKLSDSLYEWWVWRERQSKLMISMLNQFDWHGYPLSMPLWDKRMVNTFNTIPFKYRYRQHLFKEFVSELTTSKGRKFTEAPYTERKKAPIFLKLRRFTEYLAQPKWGSYRLSQILTSKNVAKQTIGTRKLTRPPKIAGISNGLLVKDLMKQFKLES